MAPRTRSLAWAATPAALALGGVFCLVALWLGVTRHVTFNTGRFDLEIYTQVVWNTAHGRPFETTLLKTNLSHLAEHVALVLAPLSLAYALVPDPRLLIAVQQLALALLGWPIYWWARQALHSSGQALLVLTCFYGGPVLAGIALDDFHALPLATLPLTVGAALVLAGRVRLGAAVGLVALPMEEESALFLIGLGGLLVVVQHRRLGLLVGGVAALWLAVVVLVVMPGFHDPRTLELVEGNRTLHHFAAIIEQPDLVVGRVFGGRGLDALIWLVLPTAGLGVVAPRVLVLTVPTLLALLLQDREDTFGRHWAAPLVVALWLATIAGLARLPKGKPRWIALVAMAFGTALAFRLVSPFPGGGHFDATALRYNERAALLSRAITRIPPSATVIASQNVVAHLANRPEAYVFPIDSHYAEGLGWRRKRPDYYVLDLYDDLTSRAAVSERLNPLNADRPYHVWSAGHKVMVLSDAVDPPTVSFDRRYGDRLWLKGYDLLRYGNSSRLVLHWERYGQVRGRYDRELTVIDSRGERVLFEEDMPLSALYGSNKWSLGQTILDEIVLPNAPGPLRIRVAWVAQDKRTPIRLADGAVAVELVVDGDP